MEDENTSPSEREAAEARVAEREEELARLQLQIQEREKALPLRERVHLSSRNMAGHCKRLFWLLA